MEIFEKLETVKIGNISLGSLLTAIVLFIVCLIVIRLLSRLVSRLLGKGKYIPVNLRSFMTSAVKGILWLIAALIILDALGIPITSLVALISVVGLALSLSIQGVLGNLFSGITLLMAKPIEVGDFIELDGSTGTVKSIGMFYTVIATLDNKIIYIPNNEVTASKITNHFKEDIRLVEVIIGASYASSTELVHKAALEAAAENDKVLSDPAPFVNIISYGSSNIDYTVRVWVKSEDYWPVYFSMREALREAFIRNGVSIDYDHVNIHAIHN